MSKTTSSSIIPETTLPIPTGEKRWLGRCYGAGEAYTLAQLANEHDGLVLAVTKNQTQLHQLETELTFFGCKPQVFADWETLPYDQLSPHQEITSERLNVLSNAPQNGILLVSASTLLQRIASPSWLLGQHFDLAVDDTLDVSAESLRLTHAGYRNVETVFEPGEFAVRGSLMDIFPMGQDAPLRIELFDDDIESIRVFDPETQRTAVNDDGSPVKLTSFRILPAHEFPLHEGKDTFRQRFAETFPQVSARKFGLHEDVMQGLASQGIEYYLPLFFDADDIQTNGHLFSYLPKNTLIVADNGIDEGIEKFWHELNRRHNDLGHDVERPIMPPEQLYLNHSQLNEFFNGYGRVILSENDAPRRAGAKNLPFKQPPVLSVVHQADEPLEALISFIEKTQKDKIPTLFIAESAGRREILLDLISNKIGTPKEVTDLADFTNSRERLGISIAMLDRGLYLPKHINIISETQLFGRQVLQRRSRKKATDVSDEFLVKSITELAIGDPVVHIDHGIGRYAGLVMLDIGGDEGDPEQEFLQLKYADDASIYVPVANLQMISRYSGGDPSLAPLHRIGSEKWSKAKQKALEKIHDVAAELLNIQARRDAKPGINFKVEETAYDLFASQFEYEETPDQANAIIATLHDMKQNKPMDRLVCGDVGFGKTEVAMRAAFVAVQAGYQVAVLVPTTLLAQQHEDNFRSRFADWPIRIDAVSRFGGKKKQTETLEALEEGKVDILIGTHKLLQPDVKFKNLGLMIVDEEHRFGVRDKEKIKALRTDVDMLTLTATPIPRTLNMSLSGMRDLSIIATPPQRRLAVKTFVVGKTDSMLKEAILREVLRGGQVYYLHNDVASIERTAENIRELLPEARVGVAHGQMRERELEQVMQQFYHKKHNVLVCTTIVETGIDIPNANTIIMERADKLGLAQMHQLRGRVGRSHHQAYAYLLVPSVKGLKGDAKKRLDAIQRANTLGAGFMLASEDLEIRGAGELLGQEQSGNMQAIGFSLYMDMLERATKAIKNGIQPDLENPLSLTSDINLHMSAIIPDDYLGDVHLRLLFYKRISNARNETELLKVRMEMIDRFGSLPEPTIQLFEVHRIRLLAEPLLITKVDFSATGGKLAFAPSTPVEAIQIIQLLQSNPKRYRMDGAHGLRVTCEKDFAKPKDRIENVKNLLGEFKSP